MTGSEARAHPSAAVNGSVWVHVFVAYNVYGPGPHRCVWCGAAIDWKFRNPKRVGKIVVDHLDFDKHNNDRSNRLPPIRGIGSNARRGVFSHCRRRLVADVSGLLPRRAQAPTQVQILPAARKIIE